MLNCRLLLIVGLFLFTAPFALPQGQTVSARLSGTITDSAGGAIPQAHVSLVNPATNFSRDFTTNDSGHYSFPLIPPGSYELRVQKTGFNDFDQKSIVLEVGQDSTANVVLTVGAVSQTMTVEAGAVMLDTGSANVSSDVNSQQAVELPLNQRNVFGLVALDSSVTNAAQYQVLNPPGSQGGVDQDISFFQFGGGRFGTTAFLLDGGWNGSGDWNGIIFVPTVDELQEDRIQTTTFSPEFGWSTGNVVNAITKSGTSSVHGDAYEFLRNSVLDANNFFNNATGQARPAFRRNQFGATFGAPLYIPGLYKQRDKTFIFAAFEALRQGTPTTVISTIPTLAERSGDLSALGKTIYNPFSTTFLPNGAPVRQPFAGNVIPANLINPVSAKILSYYPTPTNSNISNNYAYTASLPLTGTQYSLRVDHNITDSQHLFGRWSQKPDNDKQETGAFLGANNIAGPGLATHNPRFNGALGYTNTLSPTFTLSVNASYGHWIEAQTDQGTGFLPSSLGFPAELDNFLGGGGSKFPTINIAGYQGLGSGQQTVATRGTGTLSVDITKTINAHTVTAGFSGIYLQQFQKYIPYATFNFGTDFTQNPATSATDTGDGFASFLLGTADNNNNTIQYQASPAASKKYLGWYASDEWKATRKLTFNLGLRYEIQTAPTERYNRFVYWSDNVNPISSQVGLNLPGELQNVGNGNPRNVYDTKYNNFAPRISVSYSPFNKLVIRSGYGIFYTPSMPLYPPIGSGYSPYTPYVGTTNGYTPITTLSNPFPNGYVPITGANQGGLVGVGQGVSGPSRDRPTPYINQWMAGIQYQATGSTVIDVSYVGNHGVKLLQTGDFQIDQLNPQYLSLGNSLLQQVPNPFYGKVTVGQLSSPTVSRGYLLTPFPQYSSVGLTNDPSASSWYDALKLSARRRMASGLQFLVSYTWSKYLDTASGPGGWASRANLPVRNWYDTAAEKSLNDGDIPNSLVVSYIYELPIGKGKKIATHGLANAIIGGWEISGISSFHSGFPLTINSNAPSTTLFGGSARADIVGNPKPAQQTLSTWLNPAAFAFPAPFTFGNAPRTLGAVRSPGYNNTDASFQKNFSLWNESRLQFRAEFYNLFNQVNFYAPDSTVGDASFGAISAAYPGRSIQFGLKLYW